MAILRWHVKLLCMAAIYIIQVTFILLPLKVSPYVQSKGKKGKLVLSILSCFGGGVFFGAFLMHLLPEVRHLMEEAFLIEEGIDFPVTEAIAGFGFFLILFIEKFVMKCQNRNAKIDHEKALDDKESTKSAENGGVPTIKHGLYSDDSPEHAQEGHDAVGRLFPVGEGPNSEKTGNGTSEQANGGCGSTVAMAAAAQDAENQKVPGTKDIASGVASSAIFILALSLDSFFEGLSLGLKLYSSEVVSLFVAIISHEFIMSFCIGLELYKYFSKKKHIIIGIFYAFTPIIGASIGTAIVETAGYGGNTTVDIVNGVLQSICVGTFIYCTFISILSEELTHEHGLLKSLATLVGFAFMAGMAAVPEGDGAGEELGVNVTSSVM